MCYFHCFVCVLKCDVVQPEIKPNTLPKYIDILLKNRNLRPSLDGGNEFGLYSHRTKSRVCLISKHEIKITLTKEISSINLSKIKFGISFVKTYSCKCIPDISICAVYQKRTQINVW